MYWHVACSMYFIAFVLNCFALSDAGSYHYENAHSERLSHRATALASTLFAKQLNLPLLRHLRPLRAGTSRSRAPHNAIDTTDQSAVQRGSTTSDGAKAENLISNNCLSGAVRAAVDQLCPQCFGSNLFDLANDRLTSRFSLLSAAADRRAVVLATMAAATSASLPRPAVASQGRTTAQTVGITSDSLLGIVWGGKTRCDPTDATCRAGGVEVDASVVEMVPLARATPPSERFGLDISIGGQMAGRITLGLYSKYAPESCDAFSRLARGVLTSDPEDQTDDEPAKLERSVAVKIQRDRAVVLGDLKQPGGSLRLVKGTTRPVRFPVVPPRTKDVDNGLSHDKAGLLSVRRGGGAFSFVLTPKANAQLDRDFIVIGQVLDKESMQVLARLNQLPVNNYDQSPLANVKIERVVMLDMVEETNALEN